MGALAVSQLLEDSQSKGVDLSLETATLENQVELSTVFGMHLYNYKTDFIFC